MSRYFTTNLGVFRRELWYFPSSDFSIETQHQVVIWIFDGSERARSSNIPLQPVFLLKNTKKNDKKHRFDYNFLSKFTFGFKVELLNDAFLDAAVLNHTLFALDSSWQDKCSSESKGVKSSRREIFTRSDTFARSVTFPFRHCCTVDVAKVVIPKMVQSCLSVQKWLRAILTFSKN